MESKTDNTLIIPQDAQYKNLYIEVEEFHFVNGKVEFSTKSTFFDGIDTLNIQTPNGMRTYQIKPEMKPCP